MTVNSSQLNESTVGEDTTVGPFAYVRPHCTIGDHCRVGDFVEVKNSVIGDGTKISHLTYVGDSDVGQRVNFGCGTVTTNYDGHKKYRCTIGDDVFLGCNTNLIAPETLGDGSYTAAGSTITDDVPDNAHFCTEAFILGEGLEQQLEAFLTEHPDTVLVIIDTLQKVRGGTGDGNLYASDYQDIGMLKRIADEHQIALLLIHHLRKREAGDPHMMISGTTGLVGAADSSYVLCKEHPNDVDVQLHVRGRDMEEKMFTLERDEELGEWTLMKCDTPLTDPLENETALCEVAAYVREHGSFEGTASELVQLLDLDMQPNILTRKIGRYRQELQRMGVSFTPSRTGKQRTILLRYHSYYDDMTVSRCGEREPSQNAETVANTRVAV